MDEGVISAEEQILLKKLNLGDHAPLGKYDVAKGIEYSSNNYFWEVMRRTVNQGIGNNIFTDTHIGMEKWAEAVKLFGFGQPLGLDIDGEESGLVPDAEFYHKMYLKKKVLGHTAPFIHYPLVKVNF